MFDGRTRHPREIAADVADRYGIAVLEPMVPRSIRFAEAPATGRSILDHAPTSPGAAAYRALAGARARSPRGVARCRARRNPARAVLGRDATAGHARRRVRSLSRPIAAELRRVRAAQPAGRRVAALAQALPPGPLPRVRAAHVARGALVRVADPEPPGVGLLAHQPVPILRPGSGRAHRARVDVGDQHLARSGSDLADDPRVETGGLAPRPRPAPRPPPARRRPCRHRG